MSLCSQCGAAFHCGMAERPGGQPALPCWCAGLPALPASALPRPDAEIAARCLCPDCLRARISSMAAGPQSQRRIS